MRRVLWPKAPDVHFGQRPDVHYPIKETTQKDYSERPLITLEIALERTLERTLMD